MATRTRERIPKRTFCTGTGRFGGRAAGFTLIELVSTIVIIGVLASVAAPRFSSISKEARTTSIRSLEASVRSASMLVHAVCLLNASCSGTSGPFSLNYKGRTLLIQHGYPESGDVIGGDQIDTIITHTGFDISLPNNLTTRFAAQGAPTPANCSVSFVQAASFGAEPAITSVTSGC